MQQSLEKLRKFFRLEHAVALAPIEQLFHEKNSVLIGAHFTFWLLGLIGIMAGKTLLAQRIMEREQAHAALAESEQRTRAIVSSSLDAIITIDAAGRITGWNEQAESIFDWGATEVMGIEISETIIPERYRLAHERGMANALNSNGGKMLNRRVEIFALRRDGVEIPIELSIVSTSINGNPAFCAFLRDISSRKQAQLKMERDFTMQRTVARVLEISMQEAPFTERLTLILEETLSVPWLQLQAKGSVFIVGKDGHSLEMVAQHGMTDGTRTHCAVVQFGHCLCGKVAVQQEIIHKSSIDHDHDNHFPDMEEHGHYCLPIMSGDRLLGVFNLYIDPGHQSSEDEVQLLSAVSHAIGGMIQRYEAEQKMVNGAGLAMTSMDIVKLFGGEPANFLDIGGGAGAEKVVAAMRIILSDRNVKAVLFNIFGGITRGDEVARGILAAMEDVKPTVPMVIRLVGTNAEEGRKLLENANMITAETLADAAQKAVAAAKG